MVTRYFSTEDGNLNSRTLVTSRNKLYSDIDLLFEERPDGDIYKKSDAAAVRQAVKNLLLTNIGDKPFNPYFGASLSDILFELADANSEFLMEDRIRIAIENFEPRARILNINIGLSLDRNEANVRIDFQVVSTEELLTLETTVTRLR